MTHSKIKYFIVMLFAIILLPFSVKAADGLTLDVDKKDLEAGDEITVKAMLPSDMDTYAFMATLKYDKNVFQKIDDTNFTIDNESLDITYNTKNNKFGIINKSGKTTDELFSVRLKVKKNANVGNTNIALTNITASNGNTEIIFPKVSTKVYVTRDAKADEAVPTYKENKIKEDKEQKTTVLATTPILITLFIEIFILLLVIIYMYVKHRDKKAPFYGLLAFELVLIFIVSLLFGFNNNKQDVNKDGTKDYDDVKDIIDYLIQVDNESENIGTLDVNGDGIIDINDAGGLVKHVKKNSKVKLHPVGTSSGNSSSNGSGANKPKPEVPTRVSVGNNVDNDYYVEKGGITLRFTADISPKGVTIKQVKIDGKYYPVTLNNGVYSVKVNTSNTYGTQNFTITHVSLSNGKEIKVNLKFTRYVLKSKPMVEYVHLDEKKKELSFELLDDDKALTDDSETTATLYEGEKAVVKDIEVIVNKITKIDYEFKPDNSYHLEVKGSYDLDNDLDNGLNSYEDDVIFNHSFVFLGADYDFTLTNVSITDTLKKGEKPIVSFTSTNIGNFAVEKAILNTKEYPMLKIDGNNYEVELSDVNTDKTGKYTVNLESVSLNNFKTFENEKDYQANTLTYYVLKDAPTVTNINLKDNHSDKTITAHFTVNNKDLSIQKLEAVLVDSTGKIITSKEITKEEFMSSNPNVTLSYNNTTDGNYTVKFLADYALGDKFKYTSTNIGENTIKTRPDDELYIKKVLSTKIGTDQKEVRYLTKGQKNFEISYYVYIGDSIHDYLNKKFNKTGLKYSRIAGFTANGLNYVANGESCDVKKDPLCVDGKTSRAKIGITAPSKSGVFDVTASRVQLELNSYFFNSTDFYTLSDKTMKLEVLKDAPKIENLITTDEDYDKGEVTFEFDVKLDEAATDGDESLKKGTVELNGDSHELTRGHNKVTFKDVEKGQIFDLVFKADYDLDTDKLNKEMGKDDNEYEDQMIHSVKYGLFDENTYKNVQITNPKITSEKGNNYFEKNEDIKLNFNIEGISETLQAEPERVIINDKEYTLIKTENGYEIIHDGYHAAGKEKLQITDIILNNGKKITLEEPCTLNFEVLKDKPQITDFKYEIKDEIEATIDLKDSDEAIIGKATVKITDEDGKEVYNKPYDGDKITFKHDEKKARYYITLTANYDLDKTEGDSNYYSNVILLDEIISLDQNNIELKDIIDISLYKTDEIDGEVQTTIVDEIYKYTLENNKENYFVEINMENMPSIRTKIKSVKEENGHLILVLDAKSLTKDDDESNDLRIDFGELVNNVASNETHPDVAFKKLIEDLKTKDEVTLTHNYDASSIESDLSTNYYVQTFAGKLNGNGYTIKNLTRPLFDTLKGAEINNLYLENITLGNTSGGSLAREASSSKIKGVLVNNVVRTSGADGKNGGLIGAISNNTVIEMCRATNVTLNVGDRQQNGLLVGALNNSTIKNSYAIGQINGSWNYNGGIVGNASKATLENNYVKGKVSGDFTYHTTFNFTTGGGTYIDNLSLVTGGEKFAGGGSLLGNYQIVDSAKENDTQGLTYITKEQVNKELFTKQLGFDEDVWRLDNVSYDNTPTLQMEKTTDIKAEDHDGFDENKVVLYNNLMKLMPFYAIDKIIDLAENVNVASPKARSIANGIADSDLQTKEIAHILPVDANDNIVTYLTTDNPRAITKIKIVFKDKTKVTYDVKYDKTYDMVVSYRIPKLKLDYNYDHYLINANSQAVNNLTNYLSNLNYTDNLDTLTPTEDSRIYRDFYNETTSKELKEFVLKFLSNSNYANTTDDEALNNYIEKAVKKDKKIEKVLYMYNYFRRFYDVNIGGMKLYDFMLFNMEGFDKSLTPEAITNLFLKDGNNFNTGATGSKYNGILSGYTKLTNISDLLEYMVTEFTDETDMNRWTRNQFKGYLVEIPVKDTSGNVRNEVQYTLWDHFSHDDKNYPNRIREYVLPILTLPKDAAYIISTPVQYVIGAQRSYMDNPNDPKQRTIFEKRVKSYADRMVTYFDSAYKILGDAKYFNNIHTWHHDKRYAYDENGSYVYQQRYITEEPFHKNFNEVIGHWQTSDGNAAVAYGDRIEWSAEGMMDGNIDPELVGTVNPGTGIQEYTYHTWSHESAHNIDARLFLKDNGRRFDAGGEDYADSNLMQSFGQNDIVMNLSVKFDKGTYDNNSIDGINKIGSSWTPERINSPAKIKDFYSKVFKTIYVMDYLEAQAFLELTDEEKAIVGIQVEYPDKNGENVAKYRERLRSGYRQRTADEWSKIKLNSIDDLINEQIMLYPGVYEYSSRGDNSYGGEGLNTVHWYQPNNPDGRPDSYALKWLAYEMLGYAGYDEGYIKYYSNIDSIPEYQLNGQTVKNYKTDNTTIKAITNYDNVDAYKHARFAQVAKDIKHLNTKINVKEYVKKFYEALVKDAKDMKEKVDNRVGPNKEKEQSCLDYYWCRVGLGEDRGYPNSTKVRQEIYYTLKYITNDFTNDIFSDSINQDINDLRGVIEELKKAQAESPVAIGITDADEKVGDNPEQKAKKNDDEEIDLESKGKLENDDIIPNETTDEDDSNENSNDDTNLSDNVDNSQDNLDLNVDGDVEDLSLSNVSIDGSVETLTL